MKSIEYQAIDLVKPKSKAFKNFSAQQLSFIISFGVVGVYCLSLVINYFIEPHKYTIALWIIGAFICTYFGVRFILYRYIYDRIKPIYKAIYSSNSLNKIKSLNPNLDIIDKVEQEVIFYNQMKLNEIDRLKELEKYRREFLGNVSHELKTPIFNIQGYILTLLEGGIDDTNINMLYLKRTEKSINRIITIVEDLEEISKLEWGEVTLHFENFNLLKTIEEVFEIHHRLAQEKKISLKYNLHNVKNVPVCADKKQIIVVFSNLVLNAIKYGKNGGYVKIGIYDMDDKWLIEVSDNGVGIESKHLPRIFERFFRVDRGRSREEGGTGLGLAIVKHIIDAHKQNLSVKSQLNKGTSFTFTLNKNRI